MDWGSQALSGPVRSTILDSCYPVLMKVPFLEILIQFKCGQAAQTQQEPFASRKQKEQRGNKGRQRQ